MTLRSRLLTMGIPLVVLPLVASLVIFSFRMADAGQAARFQVLDAELSLVENQVVAAWTVLSRVGFEESEFYQKTVSQAVEANLKALAAPGEDSLIIDHAGVVLLGPGDWKGRKIGEADPWHVVLEAASGERVLSSPSLGNRTYLVTFRRFIPWNWAMVTMTDQSLVWGSVLQGLVWAALGSMVFLLVAVAGFWLLARQATRPLVELQSLAGLMGLGHFNLRARVTGPDETVTLATEWNAMAERVEELTQGLEQRVAERTRDLAEALDRTRAMQSQLVLSEKMATLGQLVSGIAHELNTPLGAIGSAQRTIEELLGSRWPVLMEYLALLSADRRQRLWAWLDRAALTTPATDTKTRRQLRKALALRLEAAAVDDPLGTADRLVEIGLVEWEPGELEALGGPEGKLLSAALGDLAQARLSSTLVGLAVTKAERVIGALRIYSRQDPGRGTGPVLVAESFDTVLMLFQNRLKSGIEVSSSLPEGLTIRADADRLNQLWTNLISNALASMGSQGHLELEAAVVGNHVAVRVIDSGPGIPAELHGRIFTPFFTTKKAGEGSGLGLSICQTIVQEAGGSLGFTSVPGRTVFEARFPCP